MIFPCPINLHDFAAIAPSRSCSPRERSASALFPPRPPPVPTHINIISPPHSLVSSHFQDNAISCARQLALIVT